MRRTVLVAALAATCVALAASAVSAALPPLPPLKAQPTPEAVVQEHLDALNACNWNRIIAQYPEEMTFFLPAGQVVKGRKAVGKLFQGFCKPYSKGGLKGLKFTSEKVKKVGDTINVQWRATAPFLRKAYRGADAYETRGGFMVTQVSTFDGADLPFKKKQKK